jgi:hypothetical protein
MINQLIKIYEPSVDLRVIQNYAWYHWNNVSGDKGRSYHLISWWNHKHFHTYTLNGSVVAFPVFATDNFWPKNNGQKYTAYVWEEFITTVVTATWTQTYWQSQEVRCITRWREPGFIFKWVTWWTKGTLRQFLSGFSLVAFVLWCSESEVFVMQFWSL